jgi:hypothetical protein
MGLFLQLLCLQLQQVCQHDLVGQSQADKAEYSLRTISNNVLIENGSVAFPRTVRRGCFLNA